MGHLQKTSGHLLKTSGGHLSLTCGSPSNCCAVWTTISSVTIGSAGSLCCAPFAGTWAVTSSGSCAWAASYTFTFTPCTSPCWTNGVGAIHAKALGITIGASTTNMNISVSLTLDWDEHLVGGGCSFFRSYRNSVTYTSTDCGSTWTASSNGAQLTNAAIVGSPRCELGFTIGLSA